MHHHGQKVSKLSIVKPTDATQPSIVAEARMIFEAHAEAAASAQASEITVSQLSLPKTFWET